MKQEVADKWCKALESGQYKQTTGKLHRVKPDGEEEYCCLGVLCHLYEQEVIKTARVVGNSVGYYGRTYVVPRPIMDWSGLRTECGRIVLNDKATDLSRLNDEEQFSFENIAAVIREKVDEL